MSPPPAANHATFAPVRAPGAGSVGLVGGAVVGGRVVVGAVVDVGPVVDVGAVVEVDVDPVELVEGPVVVGPVVVGPVVVGPVVVDGVVDVVVDEVEVLARPSSGAFSANMSRGTSRIVEVC